MSELIEREALLKYPIRIDHYDKENGNENFVLGIESVIEFAECLPIIDAVPVVRCGDCGISCESRIGDNWIYCHNNEMHHKKQHFCSYGKRRESEGV